MNPLFFCAATRRNYDISLFHRNTKSVFQFKSSNISVSKRSSPLFMIQLQWADSRSLQPPTRTQRACSIWRLPVLVESYSPLPLFVRSSCSLQTLGHFTFQPEHKDRVHFERLQCLPCLNGGFRFS